MSAAGLARWPLRQAVGALKAGGVIAYPTEGVWGLGCDPFDGAAVAQLLQLKARPLHKGLILIAGDWSQLAFLLNPLPPDLRASLTRFWPGPVTCLVPDLQGQIPDWIKGKHATVAVRLSAHLPVKALCHAFGGLLVSTSANPAGRPAARSAIQVRRYFGDQLDAIYPAPLGGRKLPTPILDLQNNRWLR